MNNSEFYDDAFYDYGIKGMYQSGQIYTKYLKEIYFPASVVDFGCGRGAWLKAFSDLGVNDLLGIDGSWNSQELMLCKKIKFVEDDLNNPKINFDKKYDLAISLEVAEHLRHESSANFIKKLVSASDVIIFGAATINQGGTNHINEQKSSFWAELFQNEGYVVYDYFRQHFWGNNKVEFWYRQNTFLYIKKNSPLNRVLEEKNFSPITNLEFMNCIHPELFEIWVSKSRYYFKQKIINLLPLKLVIFLKKIKVLFKSSSYLDRNI